VVIGAGSAGLVSSYIAAAVKAKVALIEKHKMGGDCLNTGCVPSKALIRSAKMLAYGRRAAEFGLNQAEAKVDFAAVMERVQRVISKVEPHDSIERYTSLGVECLTGEARITSPYTVEVNGRVLTTRSIIIATGASPFVPPIPGLKEAGYLTSDTLWELRDKPDRLVVLGGGPIGAEMTQAFARLGCQVTQVEMAPRLMIREDPEVSALIHELFEAEGVRVLTGHAAKQVVIEDGEKMLLCEHQGAPVRIPFDQIIVAVGRKPNVTGFGLEELGVRLSERGTIDADPFLRTNLPNILCAGDVAGPYQFTHTASHQAWYAAVNALFSPFKSFAVDYRVIPWCTFTDPEVARVGLSEEEARQQTVPFEVTRYPLDDLDRAIADSEAHGWVKVLTVPGKDKILGVTIVGPHAGDLLAEYVLAMKHGIGLNKILGTIHVYPTLAEANKLAAGVWKREHAPQKLLAWVEKFHAWRRG
jgi:pyruvate/2-oxoglutarate dehydrogenase complex dihydrolipoamide dehydrogenase (E3) component